MILFCRCDRLSKGAESLSLTSRAGRERISARAYCRMARLLTARMHVEESKNAAESEAAELSDLRDQSAHTKRRGSLG